MNGTEQNPNAFFTLTTSLGKHQNKYRKVAYF